MAQPSDGGTGMTRRTLFGLTLAALTARLIVGDGATAAHADTGGGTEPEEYEIPDGIGSAPWW